MSNKDYIEFNFGVFKNQNNLYYYPCSQVNKITHLLFDENPICRNLLFDGSYKRFLTFQNSYEQGSWFGYFIRENNKSFFFKKKESARPALALWLTEMANNYAIVFSNQAGILGTSFIPMSTTFFLGNSLNYLLNFNFGFFGGDFSWNGDISGNVINNEKGLFRKVYDFYRDVWDKLYIRYTKRLNGRFNAQIYFDVYRLRPLSFFNGSVFYYFDEEEGLTKPIFVGMGNHQKVTYVGGTYLTNNDFYSGTLRDTEIHLSIFGKTKINDNLHPVGVDYSGHAYVYDQYHINNYFFLGNVSESNLEDVATLGKMKLSLDIKNKFFRKLPQRIKLEKKAFGKSYSFGSKHNRPSLFYTYALEYQKMGLERAVQSNSSTFDVTLDGFRSRIDKSSYSSEIIFWKNDFLNIDGASGRIKVRVLGTVNTSNTSLIRNTGSAGDFNNLLESETSFQVCIDANGNVFLVNNEIVSRFRPSGFIRTTSTLADSLGNITGTVLHGNNFISVSDSLFGTNDKELVSSNDKLKHDNIKEDIKILWNREYQSSGESITKESTSLFVSSKTVHTTTKEIVFYNRFAAHPTNFEINEKGELVLSRIGDYVNKYNPELKNCRLLFDSDKNSSGKRLFPSDLGDPPAALGVPEKPKYYILGKTNGSSDIIIDKQTDVNNVVRTHILNTIKMDPGFLICDNHGDLWIIQAVSYNKATNTYVFPNNGVFESRSEFLKYVGSASGGTLQRLIPGFKMIQRSPFVPILGTDKIANTAVGSEGDDSNKADDLKKIIENYKKASDPRALKPKKPDIAEYAKNVNIVVGQEKLKVAAEKNVNLQTVVLSNDVIYNTGESKAYPTSLIRVSPKDKKVAAFFSDYFNTGNEENNSHSPRYRRDCTNDFMRLYPDGQRYGSKKPSKITATDADGVSLPTFSEIEIEEMNLSLFLSHVNVAEQRTFSSYLQLLKAKILTVAHVVKVGYLNDFGNFNIEEFRDNDDFLKITKTMNVLTKECYETKIGTKNESAVFVNSVVIYNRLVETAIAQNRLDTKLTKGEAIFISESLTKLEKLKTNFLSKLIESAAKKVKYLHSVHDILVEFSRLEILKDAEACKGFGPAIADLFSTITTLETLFEDSKTINFKNIGELQKIRNLLIEKNKIHDILKMLRENMPTWYKLNAMDIKWKTSRVDVLKDKLELLIAQIAEIKKTLADKQIALDEISPKHTTTLELAQKFLEESRENLVKNRVDNGFEFVANFDHNKLSQCEIDIDNITKDVEGFSAGSEYLKLFLASNTLLANSKLFFQSYHHDVDDLEKSNPWKIGDIGGTTVNAREIANFFAEADLIFQTERERIVDIRSAGHSSTTNGVVIYANDKLIQELEPDVFQPKIMTVITSIKEDNRSSIGASSLDLINTSSSEYLTFFGSQSKAIFELFRQHKIDDFLNLIDNFKFQNQRFKNLVQQIISIIEDLERVGYDEAAISYFVSSSGCYFNNSKKEWKQIMSGVDVNDQKIAKLEVIAGQ